MDANRRQLLGARGTQRRPAAAAGGSGGALGSGGAGAGAGAPTAAAAEREQLETANDQKVDGLRGRVGEMKHLAIDIGAEVRAHNDMLDGFDESMDKTGAGLAGTLAQLRRLSRSGAGGHMCILAVFAFLFLLLVYLLLK